MRCVVGPKKVRRLREQTGLDVLTALVRGNTDHRIDLCLSDGTVMRFYKDGTLVLWEGISWPAQDWMQKHARQE